MEPLLCWVVALGAEAKPLVSAMGLKQGSPKGNFFPFYFSKDGRTRLVVSGIGKINAAAATASLAATIPEGACAAWINFGIAGSGFGDFGTTFLAAKITEDTTGRSWYPGNVAGGQGAPGRVEVRTLDRATDFYPSGRCLVEMEAAGFYQTALRFSIVEFCQVAKVVSDDPRHPISEIDKQLVSGLCEDAYGALTPWLAELFSLLESESEILRDPPEYANWMKQVPFSATQGFQLRRLLQRWHALHPETPLNRESFSDEEQTAREYIRVIREKLQDGISL